MKRKKVIYLNSLILGFLFFILTDVGAQLENGGVSSNFTDAGVGARSLSLGGAFVALADDPTAIYWNPAALDYLEYRSGSFYYTGLNFGSSNNFIGLAYPTIEFGAFGFGWTRFGTDDVKGRAIDATATGNSDVSHSQFLFSYGKKLSGNISLGLSFKIETMNMAFANLSDSGIGADLALYYKPEFDSSLLQNMTFGINLQNALSPEIRLEQLAEGAPVNFKIGLAKAFVLGLDEQRSLFRVLLDFNIGENVPTTVHLGTEYAFKEMGNLRIGFNHGQVAFGAGATYKNIQFDYNFGKFFESIDFGSTHRVSITMNFGKSKRDLIRIARERFEEETRLRLDSELWFNAEADFNNSMGEGRKKYFEKDYLGSYVSFSSALDASTSLQEIAMRQRSPNVNDPEANIRVRTANSAINDSQTWLDIADAKGDSVRKEQQEKMALSAFETKMEEDLLGYITEHREKGAEFFKNKFFTRSLNEWQLALDRINGANFINTPAWVVEVKQQIEANMKTAEAQLQGNIQQTLRKADAYARQGRYEQAIEELNQVRNTGMSDSERKQIERKIRTFRAQLTYDQNFKDGVRFYSIKDWQNAADAFQRALSSSPNNSEAKNYYEEANARSRATNQPMPPTLRAKYLRALTFYRGGKYQETIDMCEDMRKEQPFNKRLLDLIDQAREKLK